MAPTTRGNVSKTPKNAKNASDKVSTRKIKKDDIDARAGDSSGTAKPCTRKTRSQSYTPQKTERAKTSAKSTTRIRSLRTPRKTIVAPVVVIDNEVSDVSDKDMKDDHDDEDEIEVSAELPFVIDTKPNKNGNIAPNDDDEDDDVSEVQFVIDTKPNKKSVNYVSTTISKEDDDVDDHDDVGDDDDDDDNDDNGGLQFVIDTTPFNRTEDRTENVKRTSALISNVLDESGSETDDDDDDIDDNESVSGDDDVEMSEEESDEDDDVDELNVKDKSQLSTSTASPLRRHVSEEIRKITLQQGDRSELTLSSKMDPGITFTNKYIQFDIGGESNISSQSNNSDSLEEMLQKSHQDKLLKNSVITAGFEKKHNVPKISFNQQKKHTKVARESKTGRGWFDMPVQEMTEELRNDLRIVRMRSALDPKRFYKHNDMKALPKFVQMGTVVDSPVDFYHSRIPKKQRKQTVVDELLTDADMRRYNKRKYLELQDRSRNGLAGKFKGKKFKKFKK